MADQSRAFFMELLQLYRHLDNHTALQMDASLLLDSGPTDTVSTTAAPLPSLATLSTLAPAARHDQASAGICAMLHFSYLWECMLFWELFLPVVGLIWFCRKMKSEPLSWVWLYTVLHANASVWVWIAYFMFTYNYCWDLANHKCPDCSTVACTGGVFLGISLVISIIAAIANDQYYPDARMTPREAKHFFQHLQTSQPEMGIILRTHVNSFGDWKRAKKNFYPQIWSDNTPYPDVMQAMSQSKSLVYKITMDVFAKSVEATDDLRAFVWDFGQEHNLTITLEDIEEYAIGAVVHPAQNAGSTMSRRSATLPSARYGRYEGAGIPKKQPTVTTEKTIRILVRQDGELPWLLDCLLRFAWILNLIGLSGLVLYCLTDLQAHCEKVHIQKGFGPRRSELSVAAHLQEGQDEATPRPLLPFATPPPRYVSVVALSHCTDKLDDRISLSCNDDQDLPSYEDAVLRHQQQQQLQAHPSSMV